MATSNNNMIRFGPKNDNDLEDEQRIAVLSVSVIPDGPLNERLLFQLGFTAKLLTSEETRELLIWLTSQILPADVKREMDDLIAGRRRPPHKEK